MKYFRSTVLLCCLAIAGTQAGNAQDLAEQLRKLAGKNALNYVKPIVQGWGAGLNSGFYHTADLHDVLGFDLQLKVTAAKLTDDDKFYQFEMPDELTYTIPPLGPTYTLFAGQDYDKFTRSSTVVGSKDETVLKTKPSSPVGEREIARLPGGFAPEFPLIGPASPLIVPQASIGLPFGIEVIGRFIPTTTISGEDADIGKVNFLGFGVRHDIDQYIPIPLPIDIAAHFMTQEFNLKDAQDKNLISASATAYGLEVSTKALILTLYGGFQLETATFEIGPYTATFQEGSETRTILVDKFEVESKNTSRFHAGLRLVLAVINVHADYSFAETPVITAGIGITLR